MIKPHARSGPTFARLNIGLLGGSFNPAHAGHRAMSLHALRRLNLNQVWWLVTPQNPLKPAKGMAPLDERVAAARTIAEHPRIAVTDIEREFGTRYTIDTLRALRRRFPYANFVWLMGADNFRQIPQWRRWAKIFKQVPVAIFRRQGALAGKGTGKAAFHFAKAWHPSTQSKRLATMRPPAWLVLDNRLNLLSGTAIRQRTKEVSHGG